MPYATGDDLVEAWGADTVTRLSTRGGQDAAEVVARALDYAGAMIDAQIGVRFALPLDATPVVLRDVAVDLAIGRLAVSADLATELMTDREKRARTTLREIAEGRMSLGLPARTPGESPRPVLARVLPGGDKLFTRDDLRGL